MCVDCVLASPRIAQVILETNPSPRWFYHKVSQFGPQNQQLQFSDLCLKITVMFSWFGPQNHVAYGLSVVAQNRWEDEDSAGHTSRSSGLLHLEASQARVS
jgi:hypothetical protein